MEFMCYLNKSNKMQCLIRILYNRSRLIFIPRTKEPAFRRFRNEDYIGKPDMVRDTNLIYNRLPLRIPVFTSVHDNFLGMECTNASKFFERIERKRRKVRRKKRRRKVWNFKNFDISQKLGNSSEKKNFKIRKIG